MSKSITYLLFFFIAIGLTAQENDKGGLLENKIKEFFELPRETIYLHLNKSVYSNLETIWFKGYVYDRAQELPFEETSNVYVGIYDSLGRQIQKSLYLAKAGYLKGSIDLDSTYQTGSYYIKASTNWMKNFTYDNSHIEKIQVFNKVAPKKAVNVAVSYDVQFLPEGGNLIEGIRNTVGVKIIDQDGYGVPVKKAVVYDKNNNQVSEFKTSIYGFGKFIMVPDLQNNYKLKLTFANDSQVSFTLPPAKKEGINIMVTNNYRQDKVLLSVNVNEATQAKLKDRTFYLITHQSGKTAKLEIDFDEKKSVLVALERTALPKGLNIITLFDDNFKPVLERLFFNGPEVGVNQLTLSASKTDNDSIEVKLKETKRFESPLNFSVSVLPESTLAYGHQENILSTFYLKPYLKGYIENPSYYFQNITAKKAYELDLLLLTQGWSRYDWDILLNTQPQQQHEFERGLTLKSRINDSKWTPNDQLLIHPSKNHQTTTASLTAGSNEIVISNYFLERDESIYLSKLRKDGKLVEPRLFSSIRDKNIVDRIKMLPKDLKRGNLNESSESGIFEENFILPGNTIELKEVTVSEKKIQNDPQTNPNIAQHLKNKVTPVTEETLTSYSDVFQLISSKGYYVERDLFEVYIRSLRGGSLLLVVNDVRQPKLNVLYDLQLGQIESYYFDKLARYEGVMASNNEVLYLYTRRGKELTLGNGRSSIGNSVEFKANKGFEPVKEFYSPKYQTYSSRSFENYGIIHWQPELLMDNRGESSFRIPNTGQDGIYLFIEGMTNDGHLFSAAEVLDLKDAQ